MRIGIIGGACHWKYWNKPYEQITLKTPYGKMADVICAGSYNNHLIFTLQRHGGNYELLLEAIPWRANVYGMYLQNLDFIIHLTACGSMREEDSIGDLILFEQLIDFTKHRPSSLGSPALEKVTYYDFSKPFSEELIHFSHEILTKQGIKHHVGGTMLTEEGPKFSSIAETKMYKNWGADFINMTSCPEVCFCREMGLPVLGMAMITNKVSFTTPILAEEIAASIVKFKHVAPKAIGLLIENLPETFSFQKNSLAPYDVLDFDLRVNN